MTNATEGKIIRVDRSATPQYHPHGIKRLLYPQFEHTGPSEYHLSQVKLYIHPEMESGDRGVVSGEMIDDDLRSSDKIKSCLGIQDALAIIEKGVEVFREFFEGKEVACWKSVVLMDNGSRMVPYFHEHEGRVVVGWRFFGLWDKGQSLALFNN